eukprot:SM000101S09244  [mRNA]  locus=s101:43500:45478:- [translate_table: standard]
MHFAKSRLCSTNCCCHAVNRIRKWTTESRFRSATALLVVAAAAMELAGRCAAQIGSVREPGGSLRMVAPSSGSDAVAPVDSPAKPLLAAAQPASAISPRSAPAAAVLTPPSSISPLPARLRTSSPSRAVEEGRARRSSTSQSPASGRGSVELFAGARLVAASPYLLHVCLFLLLNAAVSSFFYFEKAAILSAKVESAVARRRLIANINSLSAVATFSFQLTVTGRVLEHLGVVAALCATPLAALAGMAAIALSPSPAVVTIAEASRKVVNYVLTRPGREVLFTVVTREEKYKAKVRAPMSVTKPSCIIRTEVDAIQADHWRAAAIAPLIAAHLQVLIDTLVQRMGDALAAGVYHILGSKLAMGPSGVAASAIPVCLTWLAVAVALGCQQRILAAAQHSGVAP